MATSLSPTSSLITSHRVASRHTIMRLTCTRGLSGKRISADFQRAIQIENTQQPATAGNGQSVITIRKKPLVVTSRRDDNEMQPLAIDDN